jgi:Tol biopolymer transport system component
MTPEEWNRLFDLFHAVREKSGGERAVMLETACGEDTLLRKAIEELLREDEAASGFLSEPLFSSLKGEVRANPILPDQRLGRYVTLALIGRGGMGEVWSARDTDLDRLVALKFLTSETLVGLDPQLITREAKAASALNHPGIVTIHEVVLSGPSPAIVMELVEGKPLREICGKPLPLPDVLDIALQIAEALAAAHAGDVIHGDIKPENILLRPDHYVKLLDFGLARKVTTETLALGYSPLLGTLRYMSPEQARAEPLTPASDVFSLGLVLYELLAGRHAFPATSALETAQGILEKEPASLSSSHPPHVPARLDLLVRAMLAKEPSARPTADGVARTLRELRHPRKDATTVVLKWAIAALLIVVVCVAGWQWKQDRLARKAPAFRQITTLIPENRATAAAISSDGKMAAYANVDGIFVRTVQNGDTRMLSTPEDFLVDHIAWFRDGTMLAASGISITTSVPAIWIVSVAGQTPRLLRQQFRNAVPSPDGTRIAMISQDRSAIWVVGTHGEDPRPVVRGSNQDIFPLAFWSPDSKRLGFQRLHLLPEQRIKTQELEQLYDRSYKSVEIDTGRVTAEVPGVAMSSAAALPDGRILFVRYLSPSTQPADEFDQLWEMRTDPSTGAINGSPHKVMNLVDQYETHISGLSASADGNLALVLKRSEQNAVFVADFDEASPQLSNIRRLTLDERTSYPHAWTADGRSVIFESIRNGTWDLFIQDLNQHTPKTLVATPLMEVLPQLSPDGRWVLYAATSMNKLEPYTLMRVPVEGGTPEKVPIGGPLDEFRCSLSKTGSKTGRCVLRVPLGREFYVFYDLDPLLGKGRELARTKWFPMITGQWDISPDGQKVAVPIPDPHAARLRIIDLQAGSTPGGEHEVVLPGITDPKDAIWSASGRGWLLWVNTRMGSRMVYVYPNGASRTLGDISGWAVPSPDGHRLAFVNAVVDANAWLIDRR